MAATSWRRQGVLLLLFLLVCGEVRQGSARRAQSPTATFRRPSSGNGDPYPGKHDNSWCFKGVYDYDNCPEKETLLACVRCCSELKTYYQKPPSKNVCLAACADRFPKLGIEWIYP